jgi:hypothetical protein
VHQRSAKYCLKIQGRLDTSAKFSCTYCNKEFSLQSCLTRHIKTCKYKENVSGQLHESQASVLQLEHENTKLREELSVLFQQNASLNQENVKLRTENAIYQREKEIAQGNAHKINETLAKRATRTTNIQNNLVNLAVFDKTTEDIEQLVDNKYDKNYLIQGPKGVAQFKRLYILKSRDDGRPIYIVTDYNRGNGKYKLNTGEIVNDLGMLGLTRKIYPSVKRKATKIATKTAMNENALQNELLFKKYQEVYDMDNNNISFCRELTRIIEVEKCDVSIVHT